MDKLHLELTIDQVNLVFASLGKAPYETVFQLVEELNKQLVPQIQAANAKAPESAE